MNNVTYKCPRCSGAIIYDGSNKSFICPFCDSTFTENEINTYAIKGAIENDVPETIEDFAYEGYEVNTDVASVGVNEDQSQEKREKVNVYSCEHCGAEVVTTDTTTATTCPYCDNPIIFASQMVNDQHPDFVIPFKVNKQATIDALKKFYEKKFLLPKIFKNENVIKEIKGVYAPYWLYSCEAESIASFDAIKVRKWQDSRYYYTEDTIYRADRTGSANFKNIPVDASSKMNDDYMDSLEPYNFEEMVDFNQAYLSGYLADRYDVKIEDCYERINERVDNTLTEYLQRTVVGYNNVRKHDSQVMMKNGTNKFALLPVWILNTKYKNELYTFVINGQTGKVAGRLPVDKAKRNSLFLGIVVGIMAIVQPILFLTL